MRVGDGQVEVLAEVNLVLEIGSVVCCVGWSLTCSSCQMGRNGLLCLPLQLPGAVPAAHGIAIEDTFLVGTALSSRSVEGAQGPPPPTSHAYDWPGLLLSCWGAEPRPSHIRGHGLRKGVRPTWSR